MLYLFVKVYYPVRHDLVQHMVSSIQRLGFSPTSGMDHRKLAVELVEVIIKWALCGIKEENVSPDVNSFLSSSSLLRELVFCRPKTQTEHQEGF